MENQSFDAAGLQQLRDAMADLVTTMDRPGIVTLVARGREVPVDAVGTHEFGGGSPTAARPSSGSPPLQSRWSQRPRLPLSRKESFDWTNRWTAGFPNWQVVAW